MKLLLALLVLTASLHSCPDTWEKHWIKALELQKHEDHSLANIEYTHALILSDTHDFIYINKAENHYLAKDYYKALECLYEVIDNPKTLTKDRIDALLLRMRCYISLEMFSKFQEDYIWWNSLDPNIPKFEYTETHIIVRHVEKLSTHDRNALYDMWKCLGICDDISKIKDFGDIYVIDLPHSSPCPCTVVVPKMSEYKIVPHHGNGGRALDPKTAETLLKKQIDGCKWYCDNIAIGCIAVLTKYTPKGYFYNMGIVAIQTLKGKCIGCCEGNNGFYEGCVLALNDWIAKYGDKPYMPEG